MTPYSFIKYWNLHLFTQEALWLALCLSGQCIALRRVLAYSGPALRELTGGVHCLPDSPALGRGRCYEVIS